MDSTQHKPVWEPTSSFGITRGQKSAYGSRKLQRSANGQHGKKKKKNRTKRVENAVESKQKRRQRWHMALTFHQHRGDLKMGKGKAPSESNVSTWEIRHQAQSTSASMLNRTRQGSTYLGTETKRWILASTSGCDSLLCPQRHCLKY